MLGSAIAQIRPVLNSLLNDEAIREAVTYRKYTESAFSEAAGHVVSTYVESTIQAIRLKDRHAVFPVGTGSLQAGDVAFLVRYEDLPEGASTKDQVKDGAGKVTKIKEIRNLASVASALVVESD